MMATRGLRCEKCGSEFFQEAEFRQYRGNAYSAAPGGAMYPLDGEGGPARVCLCLCGHPIPLLRRSIRSVPASFSESLTAALRCRAASDPAALEAKLKKAFSSAQEMAEWERKLAQLREVVQLCANNLESKAARSSPPGQAAAKTESAGDQPRKSDRRPNSTG